MAVEQRWGIDVGSDRRRVSFSFERNNSTEGAAIRANSREGSESVFTIPETTPHASVFGHCTGGNNHAYTLQIRKIRIGMKHDDNERIVFCLMEFAVWRGTKPPLCSKLDSSIRRYTESCSKHRRGTWKRNSLLNRDRYFLDLSFMAPRFLSSCQSQL